MEGERLRGGANDDRRDDEQERRVRLLLLGKGAVLAHRFERPLAAELDEYEQRPIGDADDCSAWIPAVSASLPLI